MLTHSATLEEAPILWRKGQYRHGNQYDRVIVDGVPKLTKAKVGGP